MTILIVSHSLDMFIVAQFWTATPCNTQRIIGYCDHDEIDKDGNGDHHENVDIYFLWAGA